MTQTVREFIQQSYQLISASTPTVPLQGSDLSLGIQVMNQILNTYASTGLMLTIAKEASTTLSIGQRDVFVGPSTFVPTPNITLGRLANLESAWLLLQGVTYPMIMENRSEFLAAWKYDPLQGLPRFVIMYPDTGQVALRLYPAPSQPFEFFIRGKFQLDTLTSNDDMSSLPDYYQMFLLYAVARYVAKFKGRNAAWTPDLEADYRELKDVMESASEINVSIVGDRESLLNGRWAIMSGVS